MQAAVAEHGYCKTHLGLNILELTTYLLRMYFHVSDEHQYKRLMGLLE